jgi:hypothetical protein
VKKINPLDVANEQYWRLTEKMESAVDIQEKILIFRRLTNLLSVMEFLITVPPGLPNRTSHSYSLSQSSQHRRKLDLSRTEK